MSRHKYSKIVIVSLMILFVLPSLSPAQKLFEQKKADVFESDFKIEYTVTFSTDDLIFGNLMGYDTVKIVDGTYINDVGKPMIPIKNIQFALPSDMQATNIITVDVEQVILPGLYNIIPVQPLQHTDVSKDMVEFIYPDETYFESIENYPNKNIELVGQSDLAGQPIAEITIYPVHYSSANKQLSLITSIEFIVEGVNGYICGDYLPISSSEQAIESYENMITDMVENPDDVILKSSQNPQRVGVEPGDYDYVVITTTSFDDYFEPLVEWKTQKGIPANIVTTTWIYSEYSGTNQQKIRAFVQDAHSTWGATYFLLGGDTGYVPYYTKYYLGDSIPTDTYYADYDDDWICEVHVGRASVYTTGSGAGGVTNFVNKILTYEKDPPLTDYAKKASLFGFDLDYMTDGEDAKIDIDNYYIPSDWDMTNVYDSHGGDHEINVKTAVNSGQNLINHIDHCFHDEIGVGVTNHGDELYAYEVDAFYNGDKQSIFYSIGCWAAAFDYSNCITEHFVRDTNGGGVAVVGNTRYGWYQPGSDDGSSTRYDRYFFRSLFTQNHYKIGNCFSDHKRDAYISMYQDDYNKYIFTELSLLGDPEMPIWKENPMTISATYPTEISLGSQQYLVDTNVPYAFICLWKDDEVYEVATANSAGDFTFSINPATTGTMYVTVTMQDYIPYEGQATVEAGIPGDVNGDGVVNIDDIFFVLGHWGENGGPADANEDGIVNIDDLFFILGHWS